MFDLETSVEINVNMAIVMSAMVFWIFYLKAVHYFCSEEAFRKFYVINTILTGCCVTGFSFYMAGVMIFSAGNGSVLIHVFNVPFEPKIDLFWSVAVSFSIFVFWWHFVFSVFPCIPRKVCQLCKLDGDIKAFPDLVDYLYYPVGAAFAGTLIFEAKIGNGPSDAFLIVEVWIFILLLSLKTTKVSMKLYGLGTSPVSINTRIVNNF